VCESFGLTLIEAHASGLHAVVSDWNGYRDLVEDGQTGFLVPTRWTDCVVGDASIAGLVVPAWNLLAQAQAVQVDVPVRYIGFDIPGEFVVGYGLDYGER